MIYVDVTQIMQWPKESYKVTGIQRVTIECFKGIRDYLGADAMRLMRFNEKLNSFEVPSIRAFEDLVVDVSARDIAGTSQNQIKTIWDKVVFRNQDKIFLSEGLKGYKIYDALAALKQLLASKFIS